MTAVTSCEKALLLFLLSFLLFLTALIPLQVYKWAVDRFTPENVNVDNTRSASNLAVFVTAGTLKVAIAFYHDKASGSFQTKSPVYEWRTNSFSLLQEIDTNGPVGVEHFEHSGQSYLVFANSKSTVDIYRWNSNRFDTAAVQSISIQNVQSAKPYVMQGNGKCIRESFEHICLYSCKGCCVATSLHNVRVAGKVVIGLLVTVVDELLSSLLWNCKGYCLARSSLRYHTQVAGRKMVNFNGKQNCLVLISY